MGKESKPLAMPAPRQPSLFIASELTKSIKETLSIDTEDVKIGNTLNTIDTLMTYKYERDRIIPQLRDLYRIPFISTTASVPFPSFTSRKCLLADENGNTYFLKEKPLYSTDEKQLKIASVLQLELSQQLSFIPQILLTERGDPYVRMGGRILFLTPFIDGDLFVGKLAQSISSARALDEMHKASRVIAPGLEIETTSESLTTMVDWAEALPFPDVILKANVLSRMRQFGLKYRVSRNGAYGWIHADVAPYNTIYKGNDVIAINDFDNAMFGPLAKDLAITLLDHCALNYAGPTSSFRTPIRTKIDTERMSKMLATYLETSNNEISQLTDLPNQISSMWVEYMALGLLRGDFSLKDVSTALPFVDTLYNFTNYLVDKI